MRRIIAFRDPEKYAKDEAFQLLNAIYAFVVGGFSGVGLGGSLQKHHYLPEAHTDFIFAIVGEEMGLIASLGVLALFVVFFMCGLRISLRTSDSFGRLVAFGITTMVTLQAALNMGVVTGVPAHQGPPAASDQLRRNQHGHLHDHDRLAGQYRAPDRRRKGRRPARHSRSRPPPVGGTARPKAWRICPLQPARQSVIFIYPLKRINTHARGH
jgi:hypothetical protein